MRICDRANDLVKSGGEWISSVWVEREASDVLEAGPRLLAQDLPAMGAIRACYSMPSLGLPRTNSSLKSGVV